MINPFKKEKMVPEPKTGRDASDPKIEIVGSGPALGGLVEIYKVTDRAANEAMQAVHDLGVEIYPQLNEGTVGIKDKLVWHMHCHGMKDGETKKILSGALTENWCMANYISHLNDKINTLEEEVIQLGTGGGPRRVSKEILH